MGRQEGDARWTRPIDASCEQLDPAFWAEPVNALTNTAFLVAGGVGLAASRGRDRGVLVLAVLTALVGIGSFLFHTFATACAALADVVPIALLIVACLVVVLRRPVGLSGAWAVAVWASPSCRPARSSSARCSRCPRGRSARASATCRHSWRCSAARRCFGGDAIRPRRRCF
jgi:hypothetical protein